MPVATEEATPYSQGYGEEANYGGEYYDESGYEYGNQNEAPQQMAPAVPPPVPMAALPSSTSTGSTTTKPPPPGRRGKARPPPRPPGRN